MSEWWTYRPSDLLMFEARTYHRLFELYNQALWPAQVLVLLLGVALVLSAWRDGVSARATGAILAMAWLWVAWAFHWQRYATINLAARSFAAAFAVQALLIVVGAIRRRSWLDPSRPPDPIGLGVVFFAVVLQPLLGPLLGRSWAAAELFGLAPDPTALATLGILLIAGESWVLFLIPLLWCAVTAATLFAMNARDWWLAPVVAVAVIVETARTRRRSSAVR